MKTRPARNPLTVARNFAATHGEEGLRELLDALTNLVPYSEIAPRFGVSAQRIQQIAADLGTRTTVWQPRVGVRGVAGG